MFFEDRRKVEPFKSSRRFSLCLRVSKEQVLPKVLSLWRPSLYFKKKEVFFFCIMPQFILLWGYRDSGALAHLYTARIFFYLIQSPPPEKLMPTYRTR